VSCCIVLVGEGKGSIGSFVIGKSAYIFVLEYAIHSVNFSLRNIKGLKILVASILCHTKT
jgi:hypothetical protein